ncbi:thioredoxin family protein [Flavobacterium gilvum]|uniref:Thioredoxin family protein n=1 Tax=Flavobacterium gilvum TaxID=1492737 RepID=A0AAC9I2N2_9FLAO|nr:thioredoxin family protein [Flavobacterium gilvum]AOW08385.1 thioredoxin family protein [Flavobacterium gilvum]KFC59668.1 thioredoxin [Flavobacterium gilvum]
MKKIILVAFFLIGVSVSQAQELKWYTDVKEAVKVSNKEKKPLMLFFTGSDWCGWCIRLQNEVLKTPEFGKWANDNVVLVELDYPRRVEQSEELKKQNNELQHAFGIQGFPTVFFAKGTISKEGKVNFEGLGNTGYVAGGPSAWLAVADPFVKNAGMTETKKTKSKSKKA